MKFTIGKKIGLGFSTILGIITITGGYSIIQMRHAATNSRNLSDNYVPELAICDEFLDGITGANLNSRSFGLTGESSYLTECRAHLDQLDKTFKKAETLAANSSILVKLKEDLKTLTPLFNSYQQAVKDTETTSAELEKLSINAAKAATQATESIDAILNNQMARMDDEIEAKAKPQDLSERKLKMTTLFQVRGSFNAVRIAHWKALSQRKLEILAVALADYSKIDKALGSIAPLMKNADDIKELEITRKDFKDYEVSIRDEMKGYAKLGEIGQKRAKVALDLEELSNNLANIARDKTATLTKEATVTLNRSSNAMAGSVVLAIFISIGIGVILGRNICRPLRETVRILEASDLSTRLPIQSNDEVGEMAIAFNRMLEDLSETMRQIRQTAISLASSSEELTAVSRNLGSTAEETSAQACVVAAACEQVSSNVNTVAAGAEEMTSSIKEIAKNSSEAVNIANSAVKISSDADNTVSKLAQSSMEIGEIIKVITSIAEQTNLLSLNATIEAARAGESGKGFAVVANEVKELAKETAKATKDIASKIEAIQADAKNAVDAIGQISMTIEKINDIQGSNAGAVEEQSATTNEMSRNVSDAAKGSQEIAQNISGVAQAAAGTSSAAGDALQAAQDLAKLSSELQNLIARFKFADNKV